MKLIVPFLLLLPSAYSAVYYIDRTGGNDARDGLSPATAWSSLGRAARAAFAPGDYILLRRGQTWNETFAPPSSGLADVPITISSYGDGARPILDGSRLPLEPGSGLFHIEDRRYLVVAGLDLRNSTRSGLVATEATGIVLRDLRVTGNRTNGMLIFNSGSITIENSEVAGNSLDLTDSYDGIRIDSSRPLSGFRIRDNLIHDNRGGPEWRSANGIFLGHTDVNIPTLNDVLISGNEIYSNGNPDQNQAGRGISGTLQGSVTVTANYIHHNASAGIYLGDVGLRVDIRILRNRFFNNALRQFGGFTDSTAAAEDNVIIVDDPGITAVGAEVGGRGGWQLLRNTFCYLTDTSDSYRAFISLNNLEQERVFKSDFNIFYSAGPRRFKRSDESILTFRQWQEAGYDTASQMLR